MNNVSKSISWADYTWNPVAGCRRGCSFCYARRIHERFYKTPFSDIVYHPERLPEPSKLKKPSTIFVGSMSDCEYWTKEQWEDVLKVCMDNSRHTFMFLSKDPNAYDAFDFPENCLQGLTMTCCVSDNQKGKLDSMRYCPRPFLSIEPICGSLTAGVRGFERVIVGAMTGPGALRPLPRWIRSVKQHVEEDKIFWKANIRNYIIKGIKGEIYPCNPDIFELTYEKINEVKAGVV